ncbi:MAG: hypothetical protein ABIL09_08880 [Gemmatimonadota bacterium]
MEACFRPTARQVAARKAVRGLVDEGMFFWSDWLHEFRGRAEDCGSRPLMESDEWREWLQLPGFEDWFTESLFPKPSHSIMRCMNETWMSGYRKSLLEGNPTMLKFHFDQFMQTDDDSQQSAIMEALKQAKRQGKKGVGWLPEVVEGGGKE